jgi:hypothetical protein
MQSPDRNALLWISCAPLLTRREFPSSSLLIDRQIARFSNRADAAG